MPIFAFYETLCVEHAEAFEDVNIFNLKLKISTFFSGVS